MREAINLTEEHEDSLLRVYCLGSFKVIQPGESAAVEVASTHKAWMLFKFLVAQKGAPIPTQSILDVFWPNRKNPQDTAALRTALSRLKTMLCPSKTGQRYSDAVIFRKETCRLNINIPIFIDIVEFERQCALAYQVGLKDRRAGVNLYLDALELYQGDFLAEDLYLEWAGLPREHYRRLYLDSTKEAAAWLIDLNEYQTARRILEQGLAKDPYLEELHYLLLQVFVKQGEIKAALKHYSYCTNLLYKELGAKPSEGLKRIYQMIREQTITGFNYANLKDELAQQAQFAGPMFCDPDQFWSFLLFERRRMIRYKGETGLVILKLKVGNPNDGEPRPKVREFLEQALRQCLRSSDLVCYLSGDQLAMLLPGTGLHGSSVAVEHIKGIFQQRVPPQQVIIQASIKLIPQMNKEDE